MRKFSLMLSIVSLALVFSGCSIADKVGRIDYGYDMCTSVDGTVIDDLTGDPIQNVSVKIYYFKLFLCADTTDSAGTYDRKRVSIGFWCSKEEIDRLRARPAKIENLDLRIVFEKPGYRQHDLSVPVEFVCCSLHPPQEVTLPQVRIEDVYLVRE